MKYWTKEVKIGTVAVVAAICVYVGINFLKGINLFEGTNTYYVKFQDCAGLQVTNAVYVNGYPVGVVREINYDYSHNDGIVASVELHNEMRLPAGSRAELVSGLMGGVTMNIVLGPNPTDVLSPRDTISGGPQSGLTDMAGRLIPQVEQLLPKIDSILTNLNAITGNPALMASLGNLEKITSDLAATTATLPATMKNVDAMAGHFNSVSAKLDQVDVAGTMANVNATIVDAQRLINEFGQISSNLEHKMNSKDNTLGLLMSDTSLHDNLNHTIQSADSLMIDLKAHPKRYVHFSVFGRKDK